MNVISNNGMLACTFYDMLLLHVFLYLNLKFQFPTGHVILELNFVCQQFMENFFIVFVFVVYVCPFPGCMSHRAPRCRPRDPFLIRNSPHFQYTVY